MNDSDDERRKRAEIQRRLASAFSEDDRRLQANPPWPNGPGAERRAEIFERFDQSADALCQEYMIPRGTLFEPDPDPDAPSQERSREELLALMGQIAASCTVLEERGRERVTQEQFRTLCDRLVYERIVCFARGAEGGPSITLEEVEAALTAIRGSA